MRRKKLISKKSILTVLAVLLIAGIFYVFLTEIQSSKIPHRFASVEEGRELLLANTEYYANYNQNDIDFRLRKIDGTIDELLEVSVQSVNEFSFIEKFFIDSRLAKIYRTLKRNGYELPPVEEIVFISTDMDLESGASGYTHGAQIYLNTVSIKVSAYMSFIPGFSKPFDELLWHELFHCLTRNNPDFRSQMYSLIHFTVADSDFKIPSSVAEYCLSNPDVEHHDSYATFVIDGQEINCFTAWITTKHYAEILSGWSDCETTALIPIDGTDTYYTREQASNFDEVFGTNTYYVIDPEECMADNFAYAMLYGMHGKDGKGYPNPEIIQGIIDIVGR